MKIGNVEADDIQVILTKRDGLAAYGDGEHEMIQITDSQAETLRVLLGDHWTDLAFEFSEPFPPNKFGSREHQENCRAFVSMGIIHTDEHWPPSVRYLYQMNKYLAHQAYNQWQGQQPQGREEL